MFPFISKSKNLLLHLPIFSNQNRQTVYEFNKILVVAGTIDLIFELL